MHHVIVTSRGGLLSSIQEITKAASLARTNRVWHCSVANSVFVKYDAGGFAVNHFDKREKGRDIFLQWLPKLGPAPRVESVLSVARYVNMVGKTLEVEVDRCSHELASA